MKEDTLKIILDNVEHIYDQGKKGQIQALGGVTFSVREGEIITIVGASGSGKTTILNIIAGFITCTRGRVLLDGKEITGPGNDRVVIFQDEAVFPWYTVEENVGYGLRWLYELSWQETRVRVDSLLKGVGLQNRRSSYPKHLSVGERKRVELARAFAAHPKVILADEPFRDIDVWTKRQLYELLLLLRDRNKNTVVLATHDVEEALILSDRIVVLSSPPAKVKEILNVPLPRPRELCIAHRPELLVLREKIEYLLEGKSIYHDTI